jgi:DNA invertase Pin-like site-specific DNA recombinase
MPTSNSTRGTVRAAAYARSSDDKQEASCPQQREWAERKAQSLGMELAAYREDEGVPGDRLDRPGLEKLFDDLDRHQKARRPIPVLLVFDQDRLSRATSWATGAIMERLMGFGVERLVTATEDVDLYDDGGRVIFDLRQQLSKRGYAKQLSKNVSRGMAQLAAVGCWTGGHPPLGYRIAGEKRHRHLVPGPSEEVAAVRELFRLAAEGVLSTAALARLANQKGWPLPQASLLRQRASARPQWTAYTVGWLLRQRVYLGEIRYGRRRKGKYHMAAESGPVERRGRNQEPAPPQVRKGCHPPLVDADTFDRAQAALDSRRVERRVGRRRPDAFVFAGKLTCACCGAVMQGRIKDEFHGYVCATWRNRNGCGRNSVHECDLLERVASLLERELSTPATIRRLRQRLEARRTGCGETLRLAVERGQKHVADLTRQVEAGGRQLLRVSPDLVPLAERELRRQVAELDVARKDLEEVERQAARGQAEGQDVEELLTRLSALPKLLKNARAETRARVVQLAVAGMTLRFDVKVGPSGRRQSQWLGATVFLRGGGAGYEMPVPPGEACRAACPRRWRWRRRNGPCRSSP